MQNTRCRYEKREPDFAHCRTSSLGTVMPGTKTEMFYCSIDNADCRYALSVGFDYLCRHSNSHAFAVGEVH